MPSKSHSRARSSSSSLDSSEMTSQRSLLGSSDEENGRSGGEKKKWDPLDYYDNGESNYHKDINRNITERPKEFISVKGLDLLVGGGSFRLNDEKMKTFLSVTFLAFAFVVNTTSIAMTHDRVPDRTSVPPLPDIVLDNITAHPELMEVPDIFVMISILAMIATVVTHPYRWIITRRIAFILGILYLMRSVTMYATVLPVSNYTVYCAPKSNSTSVKVVAKRVWELIVGGGMQITGQKKSCGDYIYSGHTVMMITAMLTVKEYGSKRLWMLKYFLTAMTWIGMGILLLARGHYTVDVLIGYYAATRMFWTYHMLANTPELVESRHNFYANAWWFKCFLYFEQNVKRPLKHKDFSYP